MRHGSRKQRPKQKPVATGAFCSSSLRSTGVWNSNGILIKSEEASCSVLCRSIGLVARLSSVCGLVPLSFSSFLCAFESCRSCAMEMQEGSCSSSGAALDSGTTQSLLHHHRRHHHHQHPSTTASRPSNAFYMFTQQNLPTCKLMLTPGSVISIFLLIGIIFVPIGLFTLHASRNIVDIVRRYDTDCVPEEFKGNKISYIKDSAISKNCTLMIKVPKFMKSPIYIYYQLDNYYQNHRRYVKSRNDKQLQHGLNYQDTSSCRPEEYSNGDPIVPCGLIAWSLFNDSYSFVRKGLPIAVNRNNIAWKSDRDHKFGKHVFPFNFENGTLIGGKALDPSIPLSDQEDLIVWMRTAALPSFQKLYGRIEDDLDADELLFVHIVNNYNTYSFGGKKKLVISTSNWLGGKNDFLGTAYVATGCCFIFTAVFFALLHVKNPRPCGDPSFLSWNRKSSGG